jgi:hypothetical protein
MVTRITPVGPVTAYKTYGMRTPLATHYRPAACVEVDCLAHLNGWRTLVDETTMLGQKQAHYIRSESGRRYIEERQPTGLTAFDFPEGQRCFTEHRVTLDREAFFSVRPGDWRGGANRHEVRTLNADDWLDDFANHQQRLADRINRG